MRNPLDWIRSLFAKPGQDPMQVARYVLPYPVAGVNLLPDEILCLATVWACIDAIARGVGQEEWNVFAPSLDGLRRDKLPNDPLAYVLNTRPNPEMTAIGFREAMLFQAIPNGNAYAEIVTDARGVVRELWPLPTDRVTPFRDPATWALLYRYRHPNGELQNIDAKKVFHLRGPGLYGLLGDNLIARAAKSMGVAAAQERYTASFFGQGANPGGVLEMPGKLNEVIHKQLREEFAEKKKGPENAHKPLILEGGMTWKATGVEPSKSQLVEGRQFQVEEVCRWFGVPPHKVQHLEHATFSNIEHLSIEFVRDAINPWNKRLEQEADYKLLHQDRQRAPWKTTGLDTRPLLSGDAKSRADGYAIMRTNGIMNVNEIRHLEGLNPIDGDDGEMYLVPSNLTTTDRLVNPPKPPPAAPALGPGKLGAKDPGDDPGADDEGASDSGADLVARQALTVIMGGALQRYARHLDNFRAELERRRPGRSPGTDVDQLHAELLAAERAKLVPKLFRDLEAAQPFAARVLGRELDLGDLWRVAALVDAGAQPSTAAARLLPG